jgi:hypothetical protein
LVSVRIIIIQVLHGLLNILKQIPLKLREEGHLEDPGKDWRIILKWIFEKWDVGPGLDRFG